MLAVESVECKRAIYQCGRDGAAKGLIVEIREACSGCSAVEIASA
jgi:hypothetical protein